MGKHSEASMQRKAKYDRARLGMEFDTANLADSAYSTRNIRSMWAEDGAPRVMGSPSMWYAGNRKHAHRPFTEHSGGVTKGMPMA